MVPLLDAPVVSLLALEELDADSVLAVKRALSSGGVGALLVRLSDSGSGDAAQARALATVAHLGGCLSHGAPGAIQALRTAGMGVDVPLRPRSNMPPPRTLAAVLQVRWLPGEPLPSEPAIPASVDPLIADSSCSVCGLNASAAAGIGLAADVAAAAARLIRAVAAVARAVDAGIISDDHPPIMPGPLESALLASGTAKARLIHYRAGPPLADAAESGKGAALASWQGWHRDHGLLTAVASPTLRCGGTGGSVSGECACTSAAGLVVLPSSGGPPRLLHIPEGYAAVQAGEAGFMLSGGRLLAAPHCVTAGVAVAPARDVASATAASVSAIAHESACACACGADVCARTRCRQALVLFCQPAWQAAVSPAVSRGASDASASAAAAAAALAVAAAADAAAPPDIAARLPSLAARWTAPGPAYADFARATASAHYG